VVVVEVERVERGRRERGRGSNHNDPIQ
jgi:hypothetical protein